MMYFKRGYNLFFYKGDSIMNKLAYIYLISTLIIFTVLSTLLFLQIFSSIYRVFSLKDTFISKIIIELSKNLHPDSDQRMSLERTLNEFTKILNEQEDWSFINNLDNNKLSELFDDLSK